LPAMVRTRDDDRLENDRRHLFVNTGQASAMLGGLLTANTLRIMALRGEIPGAVRPPGRAKQILIPIRVVPTLIQELEFTRVVPAPISVRSRRGHTTLDGYLDAAG
jgi:hypothetical protein